MHNITVYSSHTTLKVLTLSTVGMLAVLGFF